jgi:MFS transporter
MIARPKRWPPPWLFFILILPGGIFTGFTNTPMPFLLSGAGLPVDRIANLQSLLQIPNIFYFCWAPLVDMKLRRRTWLVLVSLLSAVSVAIAVPIVSPNHLRLITGVLLVGACVNVLASAAQGGLLVSVLSPSGQAKASGWTQAGNLGGGALGGGLMLWLVTRLPLPLATALSAALVAVPSLAALSVPEPAPAASAGIIDHLRKIGIELIGVLRSRRTLWGLLLLASPVGSGAAQFLLPAVASHYGVGGQGVLWVNGMAGGLVLAAGSLLATLIPGDWDARLMYGVAGLLNGLASLTLLAGNSATVYYIGTVLYLVTTGFAYARFTALVISVLGPGEHGTSTRYSLFLAAGNLTIAYVLWLDGRGYSRFGTHGLFAVEAAGNLLVFAVVASAFLLRRKPAAIASPSR